MNPSGRLALGVRERGCRGQVGARTWALAGGAGNVGSEEKVSSGVMAPRTWGLMGRPDLSMAADRTQTWEPAGIRGSEG